MLERLTSKFVDDWRSMLRWYSTWMHLFGTTLGSALVLMPTMPEEIQQAIPLPWRVGAVAVWAVAGIYARVVKQPAKDC